MMMPVLPSALTEAGGQDVACRQPSETPSHTHDLYKECQVCAPPGLAAKAARVASR